MKTLPYDVQRYILDFIPHICTFCLTKFIKKDSEFCSKGCTIHYHIYYGHFILYPHLRLVYPHLRLDNN